MNRPQPNRTSRRSAVLCRLVGGLAAGCLLQAVSNAAPSYAVVVSEPTRQDPGWNQVVTALVEKHGASVLAYESDPAEVLPDLRRQFPRHACFVARPEEAGRAFVSMAHRLARQLDDDPYTDLFWGVLTGYDAAAALRIARQKEPLSIRKAAAGTEIALEMFEEGVWYCELEQHRLVVKKPGGQPVQEKGPGDTTEALVRTLTDFGADLFVTSGHATERDWQIGFRYRNGSFRCQDGELFGLDTQDRRFPVRSPHPKVYLPVGNCLMGHIDSRQALALAFMNSAGVCQMFGYTVPTWYGYAGWGVLDYFVEQPGRFTFTEAFFANHAALIHRLNEYFPDLATVPVEPGRRPPPARGPSDRAKAAGLGPMDGQGLLFDRDVVAFFGDPAWEARLVAKPCAWDQTLVEKEGVYTLEIAPRRGARSFQPVNTNGSQRGGRPIVHFLPDRVGPATLLEGAELQPVVTDNFILVPLPRPVDPDRVCRVRFRAERLEKSVGAGRGQSGLRSAGSPGSDQGSRGTLEETIDLCLANSKHTWLRN